MTGSGGEETPRSRRQGVLCRSEQGRVDRIEKNLGGNFRCPEITLRADPREFALIDDVIGPGTESGQASVEPRIGIPVKTGIGDPVLIPDEFGAPFFGNIDKFFGMWGQGTAYQIDQVEFIEGFRECLAEMDEFDLASYGMPR
jgi:hypothetical protein